VMFTLVHAMFTDLFTGPGCCCGGVCSSVHTPLGVNSEHTERTRIYDSSGGNYERCGE